MNLSAPHLASVLILLAACGPAPGPTTTANGGEQPAHPGLMLDHTGELDDGDLVMEGRREDHFEIDVRPGERLTVEVTSADFDPLLAVMPPNGQILLNDDWNGDRQRSRLDFLAPSGGRMKIRVTSYAAEATGAYRVVVVRDVGEAGPRVSEGVAHVIPTLLRSGQDIAGALQAGDAQLGDGAFYDQLNIQVDEPIQLAVTGADQQSPLVEVLDPNGQALRPTSPGVFTLGAEGLHRAIVTAGAPGRQMAYRAMTTPARGAAAALARTHHQSGSSAVTQSVQLGQRLRARLEEGDSALPSGELADRYSFQGRQGATVSIEMRSEDLDSFLLVEGPRGRRWEDDDSGGGLNSALSLTLPSTGTYQIIATSYRSGESGAYELKVFDSRNSAPTAVVAAAPGQRTRGSLAAGDRQLNSGEHFDEHTVQLAANQRIRIEARSSDFDTYLIVQGPSGHQEDNDDQRSGDTNAALDFVSRESGPHRILVTSYRPGETGAYELVIGGPGASPGANPPNAGTSAGSGGAVTQARPGRTRTQGRLEASDSQLSGGEHADRHRFQLAAGQAVRLSLTSPDFDTYLIVRTPSGRELNNDDVESGNLNSAVDLHRTEAGVYDVTVTSYSAGETGAYELAVLPGASIPVPSGPSPTTVADTAARAAAGGGRVFGVFAGITNYPSGTSDLPECANDAVKLAQTLRDQGLVNEASYVLLTDAEANRANIRSAMRQMASRVGPNDVFIFFYSGHGGRHEGRRSSDRRELDGHDEYLYVHDGEILDDEMGTMFDGVNARLSVLALDACFAGGFAKDVITRPGRLGLFSSEEDVTSAVAGAFQAGGYLSHFLRTGFEGGADEDPRDGVLTVGELTHYLTVQFGRHVTDVRTSEGYQHLVVDRGAVGTEQVLWAYR